MVEEGYRFLDEKRIMLAQALLHRLEVYRELRETWVAAEQRARQALTAALMRHGIEGLQVYPVPAGSVSIPDWHQTPFLGIELLTVSGEAQQAAVAAAATSPSNPSREAQDCAREFAAVTELAFEISLARANLLRLRAEYRRTERRVRSLENVIIPEMRAEQQAMEDKLDENDQEEVIRSHLFIGRQAHRDKAAM